ncbi:MAG: class I SAM-dependent methyltransferase [Candidatus Pacebacteria bacterium]|nr:class I SAM-dependent methyltransferase [Candidatus Paceibacterota bacterium]MCF7862544.1 class I SAM-dependent methyltransferase [Candidatus Paceibacterota bacterium]
MAEFTNYTKKGFDNRIVRYNEIHKITNEQYKALITAIDPQSGDVIFEGCAGYADVSKHIIEATKDYSIKPEIYIQDESLVQIKRAQDGLFISEDHILLGDIRKTGMPDNTFDKTVIKMGVHELPKEEQQKVFNEMYRILKKNGKFIIWELSLGDKTQLVFQDIVRKKDELAGFDALVKNRYFQKHEELKALFNNAGFKNIKDEYYIRYTFNPKGRFAELISKDKLKILDQKKILTQEDENELKERAGERTNQLIEYIRQRIPKDLRDVFEYKDLGDDIEICVNKVIMSGIK